MWRIIDSGCQSGEENLALTKTMLKTCEDICRGGTLRFFQFSGSYVLMGRYQEIEREVRIPYCKANNVGVVRRVSGGGVTYLDGDAVAWQFIAAKSPLSVEDSQQFIVSVGKAVASGFRTIGLNATYRETGIIEIDDKRLFRIHSHETENSIMCEGYIPMGIDVRKMLRSLRIPTEKLSQKEEAAFKSNNTAINWLCGETMTGNIIQAALTKSVSEEFGISFCRANITTQERGCSIQSCGMNEVLVSRAACSGYELSANRRSKSGELKVILWLDISGQNIMAAQITGDFYVYPDNSIEVLEERLVGLEASLSVVRQEVEACMLGCHIIGLSVQDFSQLICEALSKKTFSLVGAHPHELSEMHYVGGLSPEHLPAMLGAKRMPFLLPYCAKEPSCSLRYTEGCVSCGQCDIGDAYRLAKIYGLKPITIQNYEMLEDSLRSMKDFGATMFLGTCCEEFINKHYNDFAAIGMPGILVGIDNSTCYDLGHDADAHMGLFENQTQLKLNLLERVIKALLVK